MPERVLGSGRFSRFRRMLGVGMRGAQRKIAKDEAELFAEQPLHFLDHKICLTTEGAFIVAVFDEDHRRQGRTLHVIPRRYRQSKHGSRYICHDLTRSLFGFVVDVLSLPERRNYCASAYHAAIDRLFVPRTDNGMLSAPVRSG